MAISGNGEADDYSASEVWFGLQRSLVTKLYLINVPAD
ncbi:unnamed protein product, partial [marine sediment metagenome]